MPTWDDLSLRKSKAAATHHRDERRKTIDEASFFTDENP
jgi:hypothetical protein